MLFKKITHRNSRLYIIINILQNLWFVEAVWFFFFANFVSYLQIGIAFSVSTLVGVIAEIPTGVLADRFGRKKSVILGSFILSVAFLLMATTNGFWQFFIGAILSSIGRAFVSGALEAVVYDSMPIEKRDKDYEYLITITEQLTTASFALTVLIGGFIYQYYIRLPHLLYALANLTACLYAFSLSENHGLSKGFDNSANILANNLTGFKQLRQLNFRLFIAPILLILSFFFLYDWGFSKPSMALNFGFRVEGQAVIYAAFSIINIIGIRALPWFRKINGDRLGLLALSLLMGLGFVMGSLPLGYFGVLALIMIELAGYVGTPWIKLVVNERISSQFRATTLSTIEFLAKLPYVFTNILLGSFLDTNRANSFHLVVGIFIITVTIAFFHLQGRTSSGGRAGLKMGK